MFCAELGNLLPEIELCDDNRQIWRLIEARGARESASGELCWDEKASHEI